MNKAFKTIATHNGEFHTDDVFAIALLMIIFPHNQIIRTRDSEALKGCDIVVDVGGEYDAQNNRFDHHQKGYDEKHHNGALRSGFGLVWKHYGKIFTDSEYVYKKIDDVLVSTIDALDNGQDLVKDYNIETKIYTISDYFESYNPINRNVDSSVYDNMFFVAVSEAKKHLLRLKEKYIIEEQDSIKVSKLYSESSSREILILEENINFAKQVYNYADLIYVVFPRNEGNWGILAVSESEIRPFKTKKPFPEAWRGLTNEKLVHVCGIAGATFCHATGFFAVCKTQKDAIAFAKKALSA